jgi:hypothetical protein
VNLHGPLLAAVGLCGLCSNKNKNKKCKLKKRHTYGGTMAQTTRLTWFGPFFVFVGLHWPSSAAVGLRGLCSNKKIKNKM